MPIYEYKCSECNKEFERVMFSSDQDAAPCPECGSSKTEKVMSVFSSSAGMVKSSAGCGPSSGGFS